MPDAEKQRTLERIEEYVGPTRAVGHRRWWRACRGRALSIFITYASSEHLWYDVHSADLMRWQRDYQRAFVAFAIGDHTEVLIIPASVLAQLLQRRRPAADGNYDLHLVPRNGIFRFRETPDFDTKDYFNNYGMLA